MVKKALKAGAKSKLVVRRLSVDRSEVSTAFEIVLEEIIQNGVLGAGQ